MKTIKNTLALLGCLSLFMAYTHAENKAMDLPENQFVTALLHKPICKGFFSDIIFK